MPQVGCPQHLCHTPQMPGFLSCCMAFHSAPGLGCRGQEGLLHLPKKLSGLVIKALLQLFPSQRIIQPHSFMLSPLCSIPPIQSPFHSFMSITMELKGKHLHLWMGPMFMCHALYVAVTGQHLRVGFCLPSCGFLRSHLSGLACPRIFFLLFYVQPLTL